MANPRKFSEKIALHTHRQAEETARFEQIMKEVSDVRVDRTSNKNTLRINNQALGTFRGGSLPNVSAGAPTVKSTHQNTDTTKSEDTSPHSKMVNYRVGCRARSQGGPMRRHMDRKLDTSPYSNSGAFLSPPPDTSWNHRRANSDSALHQSAMQGMNSDRNDGSNVRWMVPNMNERHDGRPRSSCEAPRVPGINIYPSAHVPGTIQIPISGNNTGSLPDLTNVDFCSPISIPLDQEHDQGSSPYSSSPANTSPSTLSPTSIPPGLRPQGRFQFNPITHPHSNHLSVPVNSRYQHHNHKNITMDKNIPVLIDGGPINDMSGIYQQHCPPSSPSPTLQQAANYRSPRPSPQSSPSLGGRHSAPCSPGAPSPLSNDYHIFNQHQATQFQQHFEQLSMDWAQLVASLMESGCTWSAQLQMDPPVSTMSYVDQQNSGQLTQAHSQTLPEVSGVGNIELTSDGGYYSTSPSQLMYPTAPPSLHTTPNTPTSIPDITLTDFSSAAEDSSRHDLKQFENDLFSEETLRGSLEPLDLDGFQMLAENGITFISDSVEDNFRLDRS